MDSVLSALAIYGIILVLTRVCGRRTLAQATPFDVVLVLLIAEAAQSALVGSDGSLTHAALLITSLILADVTLSFLKLKFPGLSLLVEGAPTILVHEGRARRDAMRQSRVTDEDILESARLLQGISAVSQIRFAVLETTGAISIIPYDPSPARDTAPAPASGT